MSDKREETPDILGDVLGSEGDSETSQETAREDDEPEEEGGKGAVSSEEDGGGSDSASGISKRKATYYLREDTLSELEEVWFQLRQRADEGEKRSVSKSAIVEAALEEAIENLDEEGSEASIARRLLG